MPFPGIIRRLFANNGAGPKLRKDILPSHADTHAPGGSDPLDLETLGGVSSDDFSALQEKVAGLIEAIGNIDPWTIFPPRLPVAIDGVTFGGSDGRRAIMPGETEAREDWILCDGGSDGKGGTVPDLRGRMILGASDEHTAGSTGGSETHSHSISGTVGHDPHGSPNAEPYAYVWHRYIRIVGRGQRQHVQQAAHRCYRWQPGPYAQPVRGQLRGRRQPAAVLFRALCDPRLSGGRRGVEGGGRVFPALSGKPRLQKRSWPVINTTSAATRTLMMPMKMKGRQATMTPLAIILPQAGTTRHRQQAAPVHTHPLSGVKSGSASNLPPYFAMPFVTRIA